MIADHPAAPAWVVFPLAMATMVVLAGHVLWLGQASMPSSRRRIRQAGGMVMLTLTPLSAYLFAVASADRPRMFVLVWIAVVSLLGLTVLMACLDILNTIRLRAEARRRGRAGREWVSGAGLNPNAPGRAGAMDGRGDG